MSYQPWKTWRTWLPSSGRELGYEFRDEFSLVKTSSELNNSMCDGGPGTRTVVDTETCMSIIPNFGTALATHAGVTFGGSNNRCSYATGYSWMDFPTGFNAAAHAGAGRIVVMYDGNGRGAWGFLGASGSGEIVDSEALLDSGFDDVTKWYLSNGTWAIGDSRLTGTTVINGYARPISYQGIVGRLSLLSVEIVSLTGRLRLKVGGTTGDVKTTTGTLSTYGIVQDAGSTKWALYNSAESSVCVCDNASLKYLITPSATGCWVYKTLAAAIAGDTAQSGWNKPAAFDMNASAYTFGVYQPTSGGKLFFQGGKATASLTDPLCTNNYSISRVAGKVSCLKIKLGPIIASKESMLGFDANQSGTADGNCFYPQGIYLTTWNSSTPFPRVYILDVNKTYFFITIFRSTGAFFFIKEESGNIIFLCSVTTNSAATTFFYLNTVHCSFFIDFLRIPKTLWLPTPLLSDSFAGSAGSNDNRAADGLGHAETTGLGSGGTATWHSPNGAIDGSGALVITPGLGDELLTNGNMEAGDPPSNWDAKSSTTVAQYAEERAGGSGLRSVSITSTSGGNRGIYQTVAAPANGFYRLSFWNKNLVGYSRVLLATLAEISFSSLYDINNASWASSHITCRAIASLRVFLYAGGATSDSQLFDDVSVKQITLSTCFTTNKYPLTSPDVEVSATMSRTQNGIQQGIVWGLDSKTSPANFGLTYFDGAGNLKTDICIAGVYTNIASVATTFTNARELKVWQAVNPATGFREIHVYYETTTAGVPLLIGSFLTLTAPQTAATNGLYAGLFSTNEAASFDKVTIYDIGSGGSLAILDRLIGN